MSKKEDTENRAADEWRDVPVFRAIEEHAKAMSVAAPVFAAVAQYKGWAAGKKVEKSEFEKAVKDFLGSPIGGK